MIANPLTSNVAVVGSGTGVGPPGPPPPGPVTVICPFEMSKPASDRFRNVFEKMSGETPTARAWNSISARTPVPDGLGGKSAYKSATRLIRPLPLSMTPGVKAVAPTGIESITVQIPEAELAVSLLGEKLTVERIDGPASYAQPGRPIAVVSNVMLEYRPGPPPKPVKPPVKKK